MTDPHDDIAARFRAFAAAATSGDVDAFKALCVEDAAPQIELFRKNSARVREHGWTLKLRRIEQEGELAELTFEALDREGRVVDEAKLTFSEEHDGWKLRSL